MKPIPKPLTAGRIIILGFAAVILIGTILLTLPISSKERIFTPFLDALFTSTSATCVTGLIIYDTATYWSFFGQAVILVLIQIGGMGVVTLAVAISSIAGRKIGLMQRSTMQESIAAPHVGGMVRITRYILKVIFVTEAIGAALMAPVFCKDFGIAKGIWYSVFHSITAFCNAGFDLMGAKEPFSSLTGYSSNIIINVVIMLLIILGGIGFLTWNDVQKNGIHFKRYKMQTKVVLVTSLLLILLPTVFFFFAEFSGLPLKERILASIFQSVTTRTAGYNTADLTAMSESGIIIMSLLMVIGGSPGSTAGGLKTTTFAVLILSAISVFRKKDSPEIFQRRIDEGTVKKSAAILMLFITLLLSGSIFISVYEGIPFTTSFFEVASTIDTVGLTLGITPDLSTPSHIMLIIMMFAGRVGGLTLFFAAAPSRKNNAKLPLEEITVG
ncbi:MAG: Trk family potassium uptake protein [Oscillospiraceae bacterium]|nr:Trk family potassium uptake protein [Oscillospiraceae bacterium]